ncbi:hypothetical protein POVWA2_019500 [Plasmodium ovale wallikeri]|uniref:Uncharacterized protein n=1 Tax=Plasmodium ovale wallikeri TaxID=864142 RepID=A0A1A8YSG2_PLAOA|nr:hypothetical protein POVWA1_019230 [Plasmodium ovale wallikeri]SBT34377.1 hypothetical protein POVWA2_019500 [Plasmodium ovale wallikeri]
MPSYNATTLPLHNFTNSWINECTQVEDTYGNIYLSVCTHTRVGPYSSLCQFYTFTNIGLKYAFDSRGVCAASRYVSRISKRNSPPVHFRSLPLTSVLFRFCLGFP